MHSFVGVIPAGGSGSRLGLPYPKELHSIEPGVLYIDYSLLQLAKAGVKKAYVVVSPEKLSPMASALYYERHGVELVYVERQPTDSRSLVGSVIRGCKRANYQEDHTKFVVVLPDTKMEYQGVVEELVNASAPCLALFDVPRPSDFDAVYGGGQLVSRVVVKQPVDDSKAFRGTWGAFTIDYEAILRLRRLMKATPKSKTGDHHLMGELINQDVANGSQWFYLNVPGRYTDLGEWERIHSHVAEMTKHE